MSAWKGWEEFDPAQKGSGDQARPKRLPRVKNARPTVADGRLFQSKHEAERYLALKQLEAAGEITELRLQFPFALEVHGVRLGEYRADFTYRQHGRIVVEDAKGMRTEMYRWKKAHFEAQYRLQVLET